MARQTRIMAVRYKKHLILPTIDRDENPGSWTATAHIQFTEKLSFHNVSIGGSGMFPTKKEAVILEAKLWIDERLRSVINGLCASNKHSHHPDHRGDFNGCP